jgi:Tfp pilus assembly protein PilF
LYQKGIELSPSDGHLLATYAHFLSSIGQSIYNQRANIYFQKALKLLPGNPQYTLWYAKLLKKMGQLNKAELMYRVSLEQSKMMDDIEPIAICNYATFLFKIRKDVIQAKALFEEGLSTYPNHKGLKKNYRCLVK